MKLLELFNAVKDENLDKYKLEYFYKEMSELYAQMHLEMGDVKKKKAMFMLKDPEKTAIAKEREWGGSELGQREIELKAMIKATSTHLQSLKSRIFANLI